MLLLLNGVDFSQFRPTYLPFEKRLSQVDFLYDLLQNLLFFIILAIYIAVSLQLSMAISQLIQSSSSTMDSLKLDQVSADSVAVYLFNESINLP